MTGAELRFLRKETRLKLKDFAERLTVDPKTIGNWEGSGHLNKQTDVSVRVLVIAELWKGDDLFRTLVEFAEIAKYSWDEKVHSESGKAVEQLAAENTILGLNEEHQWDMAA